MNLHLAEIAASVAPGRHAALLVDQAGWHMSRHLDMPANISGGALAQMSRAQPSRKNLAVHVRQLALEPSVPLLRQYRQPFCDAWNKLTDQPWRIMSIGLRKWAQ